MFNKKILLIALCIGTTAAADLLPDNTPTGPAELRRVAHIFAQNTESQKLVPLITRLQKAVTTDITTVNYSAAHQYLLNRLAAAAQSRDWKKFYELAARDPEINRTLVNKPWYKKFGTWAGIMSALALITGGAYIWHKWGPGFGSTDSSRELPPANTVVSGNHTTQDVEAIVSHIEKAKLDDFRVYHADGSPEQHYFWQLIDLTLNGQDQAVANALPRMITALSKRFAGTFHGAPRTGTFGGIYIVNHLLNVFRALIQKGHTNLLNSPELQLLIQNQSVVAERSESEGLRKALAYSYIYYATTHPDLWDNEKWLAEADESERA